MQGARGGQPAERWDDEFEYQELDSSRSPGRSAASPPLARTSSPLSSLSWADSEHNDAESSELERSLSSDSANANDGSRGLRKRMKGTRLAAWGSTVGSAEAADQDVEMTAASPGATLRGEPFKSPLDRPGLPEPFSIGRSGATAAGSKTLSTPGRPPSSTGSASWSDPAERPPSTVSTSSFSRPREGNWSDLSASASPPPGLGLSLSEFLRSDGKPRRRLKKRSRANDQPPSNGTNASHAAHQEGGPGAYSGHDIADPSVLSTSPHQIIARGMTSLQRTFSLSRGRTPSAAYASPQRPRSPSSPQVALRRISGFLELRHSVVGPAPLVLDSPAHDHFGPYVASSPPPPPALRRSPSQTYSNGGFHLPTRRGSSSTTSSSVATSPRVRPKTIASHPAPSVTAASMPPPPLPLTSAVSRPPFAHSKSTPQTKGSLQPVRRPHLLEKDPTQMRASFGTAADTVESRPASRASNLQRRGHRTSSSVNSIPLQGLAHYDKPMPSLAALPALPTSQASAEPQRSASTPPTNGHLGRRNSLSDLRIPPRVASAQKALRERVGALKEFAGKVEDLKRLQIRHAELQLGLLARAGRNPSPYSNGDPIDALVLPGDAEAAGSESKYAPWWEMAEVLVKLASSNLDENSVIADDNRASSSSTSSSERARAVTMLARTDQRTAPASEGPPRASPERWRGSTGRTELSQQQLDVLRGMLTTPVKKEGLPDPAPAARAGLQHAHNGSAPPASMLLADSLDDRPARPPEGDPSLPQQRRASRAGVKGLKDFLRSLRIGADFLTSDSLIIDGGERSMTGTMATARSGGTLAVVDSGLSSSAARKSPRRPSLASIFRFGKEGSSERRSKAKVVKGKAGSASRTEDSSPAASESDWERMSVDSQRPTTPGLPSGRITPRSVYGSVAASSRWKATAPPPLPPLPPLPLRTAPPDPPAEWPSSSARPSAGKVELTPESLQPLLLHVREVERHCARCLQQLSAQLSEGDSVSVSTEESLRD